MSPTSVRAAMEPLAETPSASMSPVVDRRSRPAREPFGREVPDVDPHGEREIGGGVRGDEDEQVGVLVVEPVRGRPQMGPLHVHARGPVLRAAIPACLHRGRIGGQGVRARLDEREGDLVDLVALAHGHVGDGRGDLEGRGVSDPEHRGHLGEAGLLDAGGDAARGETPDGDHEAGHGDEDEHAPHRAVASGPRGQRAGRELGGGHQRSSDSR
jgi:hypothetical protein